MNALQRSLTAASCLLALAAAPAAHALEAGDWLFKAGATQVRPRANNGEVLGGAAKLDVDNDVHPSFGVTYMATPHLGVELLAAAPFTHDIALRGAVNGRVGSTRQLPPTLSLQYHVDPLGAFQPYVGAGINYTMFFHTRTSDALAGNDLTLGNSWGLAAQVGTHVRITDRWFANADLRYMNIRSSVKLNGAEIGTAKIDPWVITLGVGYRF